MSKVVSVVLVLVGVGILSWWLLRGEVDVPLRVPGTDITAEQMKEREAAASGQGVLTAGAGKASSLAGSWPRFRNSNFDSISTETIALNMDWPAGGPPVLWKMELGEGHAGAAVLAGRVYILDYDREKEKDVLRCLSLDDGAEIWNYAYPVKIKRNHGMSRTVPAVTEKYIVTLGPKCHVHCLDPVTGKFYWMIDLVKEYQTIVPPWYAGQCPLIDGERVILAPGGSALLIAVDGASGKVIWQSPNPGKWDMTHSSIIPMTFRNKKMYVYCGRGGVAGVSAEDGTILWQTDQWKISIATVPSPVIVGEDKIFLSGGYRRPVNLLRLVRGLLWGTVAILIAYSLIDERYRFSRALILLGSAWALAVLPLFRIFFSRLRIKGFELDIEKQKRIAIVGHLQEASRVKALLLQTPVRSEIAGYIAVAGEDSGEEYLGSTAQLREIIRAMLDLTSLEVTYKIAPPESYSIIGSNSIHTAGDLYLVDINAISKKENRRKKRIFDLAATLFFMLNSFWLIWFFRRKSQFLKNLAGVLKGSLSWVGYLPLPEQTDLPQLRPGIVNPGNLFCETELTEARKRQLNILYAKDYRLITDLELVARSWKLLDQKPDE